MLYTKELLTGAGTLLCAAGIGFVMQSSDGAKERYGAEGQGQSLLQVDSITLTSADDTASGVTIRPEEAVVLATASTEGLQAPLPDTIAPQADPFVPDCVIEAQARVTSAAIMSVSLSAPCLVNERVTVHHNGIMFTETTDDAGQMDTLVPAMSETATVILAFSNGEGAVTQAKVPELSQYDRSVLQWKGDSGFEMHAREFGANYGDDGHVWAGAARDETAVQSARGFLLQLGDPDTPEALLAEVYTFPMDMADRVGDIALSVEAEVTSINCGQEVEAQSLELLDGTVKTQDLTLSVPGCDATGSFLVLNNLIQDLKVASN